jgi:hypothetical protein
VPRRQAAEALTAACSPEAVPLPVSDIPQSSAVARAYAADIEQATLQTSATRGSSSGSILVHIPASDATVLRRTRAEFSKLEASAAALLAEEERMSQWLACNESKRDGEAEGGGPRSAASSGAVISGVDRWGQVRFGPESRLEWAPLSDSKILSGLDATLVRQWLTLPASAPPVTAPPLLVTILERSAPGAQDVSDHFFRVTSVLRQRLYDLCATNSGTDAPSTQATVDAVLKVLRCLSAFDTAHVAESNTAVVSHATIVGAKPLVAVIVRSASSAASPPVILSPGACRLYPPGAERGSVLFFALVDAAKSALRVSLDAATNPASTRGSGGTLDVPPADWDALLFLTWVVAVALVEGTSGIPLWQYSRGLALDCLLLVLEAWETALQRSLGRQTHAVVMAETDVLSFLEHAEAAVALSVADPSAHAPPQDFRAGVERALLLSASRFRPVTPAVDALLQLQAVAWFLVPTLQELSRYVAPLDIFTSGDALGALAVVLGMCPTPLRLLGPAARPAREEAGVQKT